MKIAFLQLARIGDMILSTPAFSAIKHKFPDSNIFVIAGSGNYPILDHNPYITKVIPYRKSPIGLIKIISFLLCNRFDYWIDPKDHKSSESQLFAKFANAKTKIGYNDTNSNIFDFSIPSNKANVGFHFSQNALNALKFLGIEPDETIPKPELFIPDTVKIQTKKFYDSIAPKQNILINLSATSESRIYSADNWATIISAIDTTPNNIIISYMPKEKHIAKELQKKFPYILFASSSSILEFIAIIKYADLLISPDTSAIHIATAFEKKTIAIYNDLPENFTKFRPMNPNAHIIMPKGAQNINQIPPELIISEISSIGF